MCLSTIVFIAKAVRAKLIALKVQHPNARFRLEAHGLTRESVVTQITGESGIEQPEEYFVELEAFEKEHGKADPGDVVFEETVPGSGILKAGVTWWYMAILTYVFGTSI